MPDSSRSIVVSAGLATAPPITLGTIPLIVNTSPDVVSDSIVRQIGAAPNQRVIVGTDPADAATSVPLPVLAGEGPWYPAAAGVADSVLIGRNVNIVSGSAQDQICIGTSVSIDATGNVLNVSNILIGFNSSMDDTGIQGMGANVAIGSALTVAGGATNNVLIGQSHPALGAADENQVRIGNGSTVSGGAQGRLVAIGTTTSVDSRSVAIGDRAVATGGDSVGIGQQVIANGAGSVAVGRISRASASSSVALGVAASSNHAESVAIGHAANTSKANQIVIGGVGTTNIDELVLGEGDTAAGGTPTVDVTIKTTDQISAGIPDVAGADITIHTGTGIGNAAGGRFIVEVPDLQPSGLVAQLPVIGIQVQESQAALDTFLFIRDVDNGVLERVSVGAADSGGVGFKLLRIPN